MNAENIYVITKALEKSEQLRLVEMLQEDLIVLNKKIDDKECIWNIELVKLISMVAFNLKQSLDDGTKH